MYGSNFDASCQMEFHRGRLIYISLVLISKDECFHTQERNAELQKLTRPSLSRIKYVHCASWPPMPGVFFLHILI